jgi:fumarate reductase flavoprotein subunit
MSASGIVWGVNQAIIAAGADPAAITPRTPPATQIVRNPSNPDARFLVPGYYTVTTEGFGGEMNVTVTVDRNNIRRIVINEHNESGGQWDTVWPELRDLIFEAQTTNISLDTFAGATVSAEAVVEAVRSALSDAGETNPANW